MAQGAYLAPGSVKELKSCYVGAGGVREVTQIYIGAGGVKFVWPPYIYSNGSFGPLCGGSATALYRTGSYGQIWAQFESTYIHLYTIRTNGDTAKGGVVFDGTLATGNYSSLSADFTINTPPTGTGRDVTFDVALYATKPTSYYMLDESPYRSYYTSYTINNQSGSHTLTLDMSSISGSYYVGFYAYCTRLTSSYAFDISVNQVYVR